MVCAASSLPVPLSPTRSTVADVGATRPKDDLLVTYASTKPSEFLREIALNPKFRDVEESDLPRGLTSARLRLEKAIVVLRQLEAKKHHQITFFRELTKQQFGQYPAWLQWILNKLQLWRIDRALARVEETDGEIKAQKKETIIPLEQEIHAIEEEEKMRAALGIKQS